MTDRERERERMAPQIGPKEKAFVLSFYLSLSLSLSQSQRAKLTADDPCFAALVSKNADTSSGSLEWPPYSPDLNPCDAFLWGYLKSRVWANGPIATLTELKKRITEEINLLDTTDREKISNGCNAFLSNVRACVDAEGGHFC